MNDRSPLSGGLDLPRMVTDVPGPKSRAVFRRDQDVLAAGNSAGSLWSELAVIEGRGAMIRDADGNWLLDACAGTVVMNLGHGHPAVATAVGDQARLLTHFYDFATEVRPRFVELLRSTLPESFDAFHLANSGSEAVEAALRTVRSATGRHEVIAFHNGYHGRTLGALSLTTGAGREGLGPFLPGVVHAAAPDPMESPDWNEADRVEACGRRLERMASQVLAGPPAAVIIEPLQGAGGMIPIPSRFLELLSAFCDRTGALLVFDEILTGGGRTGRLWAHEHSGVVPDLLLLGKGIGGGFPIGIVAGPRRVMDAGPGAQPTHNSSTFGGNPLACAAGLAALTALLEEGLVDNASRVGEHLITALGERLAQRRHVADVRGLGLAVGVEMVRDPATRTPVSGDFIRDVLRGLLRRGVVISSTGHVMRITPPLCLTIPQADFIARAVDSTLLELEGRP
ncbi:MAG: aminotransferase class III-fold pyridoxal phosphate-dependent enzyme [Acidimicrobiia bacterium]|nr:aminotransferase class III-fold pyridoxal phosphate-dependent enzyme [Acidimicrobiia bacterium]MYC86242.1 aminotransferase class III-fold pyridoxal phosphate-dependent enzyme [Acidimicrobiia bacterium]